MRPLLPNCAILLAVLLLAPLHADDSISLTGHLRTSTDLGESRDLHAEWQDGLLKLTATEAEREA